MNLKKLFLMLTMFVILSSTAFAQIYVSSTGGDDLVGTGSNASPYATITKALTVWTAGQIIYVADGTYAGAVTINKDATIVGYSRNGGTDVIFTGGVNFNSDAVSFGATGNVIQLNSAVTLTKGVVTIATALVQIGSGQTITRTAGSFSAAPTFGTNTSVTYNNTAADLVAGVELPANLGTGTLTVAGSKMVTVNSALTVTNVTVNGPTTLNMGGNLTVDAGTVTTTAATDVIQLNSNKLILDSGDGAVAVVNAGKIISAAASTIGSAVIELTGDNAITYNGGGQVPNVSILSTFTKTGLVNTFTLLSNITIYGDLIVASGDAGALTDGGFTINLKGNFNRTNHTVGNVVATGTLAFNGTVNQMLTAGANLTLANVTVDNIGKEITLVNSVNLTGNLTITNGKFQVGDNNLFMTGAGKVFTNSGEFYSTTGVGYVVFTGATTLEGTGIFANLDIRSGVTVTVGAGAISAKFAGTLILRSGILDLNDAADGVTLYSTTYATIPKIIRYTAGSVTTAGAADLACAAGVVYDLDVQLNGATAATYEWIGSSINNLTISKDAATGAYTAQAEASVVSNTLTINDAANTLTLGAGLSLTGSDKTHKVEGTINGGQVITVTGGNVTINGKTVSTDTAAGSELSSVTVANSGSQTFVLNNIQKITGNLIYTGGTATITFNPNVTVATDITGNIQLNDGTMNISGGKGGIVVGGTGTLTLGTLNVNGNVGITGAVTQSGANIVIASEKALTLGAAYTHTGGTITGAGWLVAGNSGNVAYTLTTTISVPKFALSAAGAGNAIQLVTTNLTVSDSLKLIKGTLDLNDLNVIVTGNAVNVTAVANVAIANTGAGGALGILELKGSNPVLTTDGNLTFTNITLNSAGTLTIKDDKEGLSTQSNNTLTVSQTLIQTAGNISLGQHSIDVQVAFTRTAGAWDASTTAGKEGWLIWDGTGAFAQGAGFVIPNLDVKADLATTALAANKWKVTNQLMFGVAATSGDITVTTADNLELADGITITRRALIADAAFDVTPKFLGKVNVVYSGALAFVPGKEWPADATTSILNSAKVLAGVTSVTPTAGQEKEIISLLDLAAPISQANGQIKMANGAWFKTTAAANLTAVLGQVTGGTMNVEFANAAPLTTDDNFMDIITTPAHKIGDVKFSGTANVTIHANGLFTYTGTVTFGDGPGNNCVVTGNDLTIKGNVVQTKSTSGFFLSATAVPGDALKFAGTADQTVTLKNDIAFGDGATTDFAVEIALTAGKKVTVSGGDFDFATNSQTVTLTSGALATGATDYIILKQDKTAGNVPTQGFTRTAGVISGNVKKTMALAANTENSIVTYPLGTIDGKYEPANFYFKNAVPFTFDLSLTFNPTSPGGTNTFPITSGTKQITNYPGFFWYVKSSQSLAPSFKFDMDLGAEGYTDYTKDLIQNVRLIRRDSGNVANNWILQGADANYDNSTIAADFPVVKVIDATGGLTTQGSLFSFSQNNKKPTIAKVVAPGLTINEGDTLKVTYTGNDVDINQTVTLAKVSGMGTFASGVLTWVTTFADSGTYKLIVSATDGIEIVYDTTTVKVNNVNQKPSFTATGASAPATAAGNYGDTITVTYKAIDTDGAADSLTYSYTVTPAPVGLDTLMAKTGVLTFIPTYADGGNAYTFTVVATDMGGAKDTATTVVTVGYAKAKGDVNLSGSITAADATVILEYVVGKTTLTDEQKYYADMNSDGVIGAYDAALVLAAALTPSSSVSSSVVLAKTAPAAGSLELGQMGGNGNGEIAIPLTLSNSSSVYSVSYEIGLGSEVDYKGISSKLPEGWTVVSNFENGSLKVAMAGLTPLKDGQIGSINLTLNNKEAVVSIQGSAKLNDAVSSTLAAKVKEIPTEFSLSQNYPNPFNPTTSIKYAIPQDANVTLVVYNMLGQVVKTLVNAPQEAGYYTIQWNGTNDFGGRVSSGIYIYRIQAGSYTSTIKMNLLK